MTTLVISDLHLGNRGRRDVLRLPAVRERLLAALDGVSRLVLLGDTVELVSRTPGRALEVAEPVLREIGRAVGPDRPIILVPGNHDGPLVSRWALAQGERLTPTHAVDLDASRALRRLVGWLAPAPVSVSYPGVWLTDSVWATHGHYLDHHLLPTGAFGLRRPGCGAGAVPGPLGYELAIARRFATDRSDRSRGHPAVIARRAVRGVIGTLVYRAPKMLLRNGMAPVTARLIDFQMRYAAIPAMARATERLGVEAGTVIFGHVHRRGPIDAEAWPQIGATRYVNTGSWIREPLLIDRATAPHPYWPGGAILVDAAGSVRTMGLLDDLSPDDIRPPKPR